MLEAPESDNLAFALEALFAGAISLGELRQWADTRIAELDRPPRWLIAVCEFDGFAKDIYRILPITPDREFSASERRAMAGIALRRGHWVGDAPFTKAQAEEVLALETDLVQEFARQFPFLGPP